MLKNFCIALCVAAAGVANASTIQYTMSLNGVSTDALKTLPAGTYNLQVYGQVTDNDLGSGLGGGGLLQYVFDISESKTSTTFEQATGGLPPAPNGKWKVTNGNAALFTSFFPGLVTQPGIEVFAQTGGLNPATYLDNYNALGVGSPTLLVSGNFNYNGTPTLLTLSPGALSGHVVMSNNGGTFGATNPTSTVGTSLQLGNAIPEPTTCILAGLALVGAAARRRV